MNASSGDLSHNDDGNVHLCKLFFRGDSLLTFSKPVVCMCFDENKQKQSLEYLFMLVSIKHLKKFSLIVITQDVLLLRKCIEVPLET